MKPTVFERDEKHAISTKKPSATVRGAGALSGGDYARVLILGAGEVAGDIRAERVRSFGSGELHGRVEVGSLRITGSGELGSDLIAGRVKALGSLEVDGSAQVEKLSAIGACEIGGRALVEEMSVLGAFEAGSVESGAFRVRGAVEIEGLLSGDSVEVHLGGLDSHAEEIGGERVEVWRHSFGKRNPLIKGLGWLCNPGRRAYLRVSTIEADDVYVENIKAKSVRGKRVWVGSGCTIDEVEYGEALTVHPKSEVGRRTKR